jgi:hypothetical protein
MVHSFGHKIKHLDNHAHFFTEVFPPGIIQKKEKDIIIIFLKKDVAFI